MTGFRARPWAANGLIERWISSISSWHLSGWRTLAWVAVHVHSRGHGGSPSSTATVEGSKVVIPCFKIIPKIRCRMDRQLSKFTWVQSEIQTGFANDEVSWVYIFVICLRNGTWFHFGRWAGEICPGPSGSFSAKLFWCGQQWWISANGHDSVYDITEETTVEH